MNQQSTANNEVLRWENEDETELARIHLRYIKNPSTPPETEAEEL